MKVYVVIKEGVYMQGIYGVYDTEIKAEQAKRIAKKQEEDDYHTFYVIHAELNKREYIEDNSVDG